MISRQTFRATLTRRCFAATSGVRSYASQTPGNPMLEIFNRRTKHQQKDRAARNVEESRKTDYLKDEVARRLCERLLVRIFSHQGHFFCFLWFSCKMRNHLLTVEIGVVSFVWGRCRISSATFPMCSIWARIAATSRGR